MENQNFPGLEAAQKKTMANQMSQEPMEPLVFNVMPRVKSDGNIVSPTIKNEEPTIIDRNIVAEQSWFSRYKFYLIGLIVLLVAGPLVYYVSTKIGGRDSESDVVLVDSPALENHTESSTASSTEAQTITTPEEWRQRYFPVDFNDPIVCGDQADPDMDGLLNVQEYARQTDPNNKDSDKDGLADGDEIAVFMSDPLNARTSGNKDYQDADYFRGGYNLSDDSPMTQQQKDDLGRLMSEKGLHEPTISSLGDALNDLYHFSAPVPQTQDSNATSTASTTLDSSIDLSAEAKQGRDAQRTLTIGNFGIALTKYYDDNKIYPQTSDMETMYAKVKVYMKTGANPKDPINQEPYVYRYEANADRSDFTLSYYSETVNQLIQKHSKDAYEAREKEEAAVNNDRRKTDLDTLRTALLLYSRNNAPDDESYVFPSPEEYKIKLVPDYVIQIPKDPKTGKDYDYQVSETSDSFTLKATYDYPSPGVTGYLCNIVECRDY